MTAIAAAPRPGELVLDACCGNGAAALPAARLVGSGGRVDAVDLAERLLAAGQARARTAGLTSVRFHRADVTEWRLPGTRPYDTVLCAFGVFFFPDMDLGGKHLLSLLRPGGRLAITTWARGSIEPLVLPLVGAVAAEHSRRPAQLGGASRIASARIDHPEGLAAWLQSLGAVDVDVQPAQTAVPVTPNLAWEFVTGAATRVLIAGLDAAAVARVRSRYCAALVRADVRTLHARALIGLGRRSPATAAQSQ